MSFSTLSLLPLLSLLLLLSLSFPSSSSCYQFDVFTTAACSLPLDMPILSTAISIPALAAATGQCSPIPSSTPLPSNSSFPLFARFTSTPLHPTGVRTSFSLFTNSSCTSPSLQWQITASSPANTIHCQAASWTEANRTSGEPSTSSVWVTIDTQPAGEGVGDQPTPVGTALIAAIVVSVVAVAGLVVAVIWWYNRTQQSSLTSLRPDRSFHTLV